MARAGGIPRDRGPAAREPGLTRNDVRMLPVAAITRRIRRQVIYWRWLMAAALVGCIPVALICSFLVHHFLAGLKRIRLKS